MNEWVKKKNIMNFNFKKLKKESLQISLDPQKKEKMREALRFAMEKPVVTKESIIRHSTMSQIWSDRLERLEAFKEILFIRPMPLFLILALILGGGVSVAAEQALPGDVLYPVKVGINESVRGWIAISNTDEAKLSVDLAERRLAEAEALASKGKLDDDVRADVEVRFKYHADDAREHIASLAGDDSTRMNALAISSDFESKLRAHVDILSAISSADPNVAASVGPIVMMVNIETGAVSIVKADAETGVATTANPGDDVKFKTAAEKKWKQANKMVSIARELFAKPQVADVATYVDAEARVKIAVSLLEQGKIYFEAGAYRKAFITFQEAFSIAQKAVIVLRGGNQFGISIGSIIEVPQPGIVPIGGQPEGEEANGMRAKTRYGEAARAIQEIRSFISIRMAVMTEEVAKKVEASLTIAETRFSEGKKYYEVGVYAKASESFELSMRAVKDVYGLIYGGSPQLFTDPSIAPTSGGTGSSDGAKPSSGGVQVETKVKFDDAR